MSQETTRDASDQQVHRRCLTERTRSRCQDTVPWTVLSRPYRREVFVQGGAFFPERRRACLSGSSFGDSCLKISWVGIGLHMEFHADDQWVITSYVRSIPVAPAATSRPS
jgi:hypothetical protein